MAQILSNMLALETIAPDFKLIDTISTDKVSLQEIKGIKATVIMFICNHCPFVKHVNAQIVQMAKDFKSKGVEFIAISSNDVENYPQDGPEKMKENAQEEGYIFPYLFDQTQEVAKLYKAACTPDFYVFDSELKLAYRGQLDDSRPGNSIPVTGKDIRNAINAILDDQPVSLDQKPSVGCNIKWKIE